MSPKGSSDFFILKCVSGVEPLAGRRPGDAELCGELSERPACGQAEEELRDDERLASTPTASTIKKSDEPEGFVGFFYFEVCEWS